MAATEDRGTHRSILEYLSWRAAMRTGVHCATQAVLSHGCAVLGTVASNVPLQLYSWYSCEGSCAGGRQGVALIRQRTVLPGGPGLAVLAVLAVRA